MLNPRELETLRVKVFDAYQQAKPRAIPPANRQPAVIIDIDERSLAEVGQWPWSRTVLAKLVHNAFALGVGLVGFDIVFPEADRTSPGVLARTLQGLDPTTRKRLEGLPSNDRVLADEIRGKRVVLGQASFWGTLDKKDAPPPIRTSVAVRAPRGVQAQSFLKSIRTLVRNVPVIDKAAVGHGIFSLIPETDGIVRRVPLLFRHGGNIYPALSLEMLRVAFGRPTLLVTVGRFGVKNVGIAPVRQFPPKGLKVTTDSIGRAWPYFSKSDKSKYISAVDVLNGTVDAAKLRGKLALVGTSAVGLLDLRATPVDSVIPGVEIHAQMIETILGGNFLSRPTYMRSLEALLLLGSGLLMIWLVPLIGARWTLLLLVVIAGSSASGSWYLFAHKRMLFDVSYAVIATFLLYSFLTYMSYAREEAQRRQTRDAFSKYLSPDMVEAVAANPGKLKLGGDRRDMSILFCDVRGFTTISEQFDAVGLTALINKLLTPLTDQILKHKGTVDKYMGDCIMAFWNAPLDDPEHARNACISALVMLEEMGPLNARLEQEAKEEGRKHIPLKVGVGVNSGECVVGNMGSEQRFDYSVLGDSVNLASRLEGQSKNYGVRIVIGESTQKQVPDLAVIELDLIKVKGKNQAVRIFTLLGDESVAKINEFQSLKETCESMISAYRKQDWAAARDGLERARPSARYFDIEGLMDLYEERITAYERNSPPADWDGVFVATSK
ncbi:CHASE2 domain-containing protein [Varunaivibrio sulfuroxidans]|nr:adenylate/guanylate cyclase domain-containing protein [Varunaivibrio sulfuroxidans]WES31040.1 adenylate/guanylate cyclase domain-containing protein [Varunaivibrio sulfuroxidans]